MHVELYFFPRFSGSRIPLQVCLPARKLLDLPLVNRRRFGRRSEIVPQILNELQLFGRSEIENRYCPVAILSNPRLKSSRPQSLLK
jgi:hypothetical protein